MNSNVLDTVSGKARGVQLGHSLGIGQWEYVSRFRTLPMLSQAPLLPPTSLRCRVISIVITRGRAFKKNAKSSHVKKKNMFHLSQSSINVHVNDRFNVLSHRRSQFQPTGPTFTSLSTDEASVVKRLARNVMIAAQRSDSQFNALTRSAIPAPLMQERNTKKFARKLLDLFLSNLTYLSIEQAGMWQRWNLETLCRDSEERSYSTKLIEMQQQSNTSTVFPLRGVKDLTLN